MICTLIRRWEIWQNLTEKYLIWVIVPKQRGTIANINFKKKKKHLRKKTIKRGPEFGLASFESIFFFFFKSLLSGWRRIIASLEKQTWKKQTCCSLGTNLLACSLIFKVFISHPESSGFMIATSLPPRCSFGSSQSSLGFTFRTGGIICGLVFLEQTGPGCTKAVVWIHDPARKIHTILARKMDPCNV